MKRFPALFFGGLAVPLLLMHTVAWAKKEAYSGACTKSVSSAVVTSEGVQPLFPDFVTHWWKKNAENYPGVCLSSQPNPGAQNYLMVFSTSERYYSGLMPTTRTYTNTSSTALSADGSVTDQYGDRWNFTATGDAQTTTTTTVHENLPYTDRTTGLFAKTYDSAGRIIRSDGHLYRNRTGGDTSNTLGYNIGSAFSNINARSKMLKAALLAVENDHDAPMLASAPKNSFDDVDSFVAQQKPELTDANPTLRPADSSSPVPAVGGPSGLDKVVVAVGSTPPGAEIEVDGAFMGDTPSQLSLETGSRKIRLLKKGFVPYERTIQITAGSKPSITAELEPEK
jgi:hypothetical protein